LEITLELRVPLAPRATASGAALADAAKIVAPAGMGTLSPRDAVGAVEGLGLAGPREDECPTAHRRYGSPSLLHLALQ
jgi:hypothetical protein